MNAERYVGIDGCRAGWFFVSIGPGDESEFGVFEKIENLYAAYADAKWILIDIPIGLPDEDIPSRSCDSQARKILSPKRHHSIFSPPCREALSARSYNEACNINQRITGRKISRQAYYVGKKILQVDLLLQKYPNAHNIIHESHPEICFWALADRIPRYHYKKTKEGLAERLDILRQHFPPSTAIYKAALDRYRRKDVARDDILDALALVVSASKLGKRKIRIPEIAEKDRRGFAMEMVYAIPDTLEKQSEIPLKEATIINNMERINPANNFNGADVNCTYEIIESGGKTYFQINYSDLSSGNQNRSIKFSQEAIKQLKAIIAGI